MSKFGISKIHIFKNHKIEKFQNLEIPKNFQIEDFQKLIMMKNIKYQNCKNPRIINFFFII